MASELYKYRNRIDYLNDFPGANVAEGTVLTEVTNTISTDLNEPLDVSGAVVTVTDDGSLEISTLPDVIIGDWTAGEISVDENTGATTTELASAADISGGVSTSISKRNYTLYLENTGASSADVTVSYSPDGGNTYFDDPEGAFAVPSGGKQMVEIGYDATDVRVSASNTEPFNVNLVQR